VESTLERLTRWGYIYRKKEYRVNNRNYYCYRHLKNEGIRVYKVLKRRKEIMEVTKMKFSLNLRKPIPKEVMDEYYRICGKRLGETNN